ncbi:class I SAM-dependent methyltransferase [Planotetraspora sp. A-T 1434]|uniref:class I SAM-dependent methyltransferase n=1 Tax=Planotetraspora sp. A-T 1434 TaxID=2979219 RepID=UPI0021C137F9|nr:class I SAM-dependent methyltransferase [Planotetraspora sp. A-T 1434]MCT9933115.1 class I SAM-dependent methyltransferase [Planotetraspora sp. A-T 1434]
MEQFHHPRSVYAGHGPSTRPTEERRRLLEGLTGTVLEIGAGDGVKFTCYPDAVTRIVVAEPNPFLLPTVRTVCSDAPAPVDLVTPADLSRLPLPDESVDAVVCSLVLCTARRLGRTLAEIGRVLRPGGELRFYEHVRSANPLAAMAESLVTPVWSQACGGCHPARATVIAIEEAGYAVGRVDRFASHGVSHVLGAARKSRGAS